MQSTLLVYLTAALAWAEAHPLLALGLSVSILGTLANSLTHFPRAQAAVGNAAAILGGVLRFALDLTAVIAKADGRGLVGSLTLPGVPTLKTPPLAAAQAPRGAAHIYALVSLLAAGGGVALGLALVHGEGIYGILGAGLVLVAIGLWSRRCAALGVALALCALPASAQEGPQTIPFGGCSARGNFCAAPAVSLTLAGYGFRTHQFSTGLTPGIGYEVRAWADKWYTVGFELRASVQTGAENRALFSLPVSFAKFLRIGPSYQLINGSGEWGLVFGLGIDSGTIAQAVARPAAGP